MNILSSTRRRRWCRVGVAVLLLSAFTLTAIVVHSLPPQATVPLLRHRPPLPLSFVQNVGQAGSTVRYTAEGIGGTLLFTAAQVVVLPNNGGDGRRSIRNAATSRRQSRQVPIIISYQDANLGALIDSGPGLPGKASYLITNDTDKWHTGLPTYSGITYRSLYPGIDVAYSGTAHELQSEFIVAPGADPHRIRQHYVNAGPLSVDALGNLRGGSSQPPVDGAITAWQQAGLLRVPVRAEYDIALDGTTVGYSVGTYDQTKPLHLASTLSYSTYLGGQGTDTAFPIAVDSVGNAYIAGLTTSLDYPASNALQPYYGGDIDVFISKLSPDGLSLVYSTYLGGIGQDQAWGIAIDAAGSAYVAGFTDSTDFPTANAYQQSNHGGRDAFVAKLSPNGTALIYSTYLGGSGGDEAWAVGVSGTSAYITGNTTSSDFPTVNPLQPANHGEKDIFVVRLDTAGTAPTYSTYLGGTGSDEGLGIEADSAGNAYLTGGSYSLDFPVARAYQPYKRGDRDAVATKLSPDGATLAYSTYLGGVGDDLPWALAVTQDGQAIITGFTHSDDFPMRHAVQNVKGADADAFVTELSASGSWLVYSTYLGGNGYYDATYGAAIDTAGNTYVSGITDSTDFPTAHPLQPTNAGGNDVFVSVLGRGGRPLLLSTYLGGTELDYGWGVAVDPHSNMYITGGSRSPDFPILNAFQPQNVGMDDNVVAKISSLGGPTPIPPVCPVMFSDVPVGSPFYPYISCLACDGIISGYDDGTYRPGSNVSRGQIAKIVANSAGFNDPIVVQAFEDVPPENTFYSYVGRLSLRGIIAGYPCGRPGQPCVAPANRPYFEPNSPVTRGQAAKIAGDTAAFPLPAAGAQTFEDVPANHTFYPWVEAMGSLGLIGGYPCGGAGEPCVLPLNRPYFRAQSNVTRGQAAKIVANTFESDCVQLPPVERTP